MVLRVIRNIVVWSALVILFIALAPGLPPYDVEFVSIPPPTRFKFEGPLAPNDWLDNVEYLSDKIDKPSIGYLKVINLLSFSLINDSPLVMIQSLTSSSRSS